MAIHDREFLFTTYKNLEYDLILLRNWQVFNSLEAFKEGINSRLEVVSELFEYEDIIDFELDDNFLKLLRIFLKTFQRDPRLIHVVTCIIEFFGTSFKELIEIELDQITIDADSTLKNVADVKNRLFSIEA